MGVVGLYLRRKTEEGPEFAALQRYRESTQAKVTPIAEAFRAHWRRILLFTAFMGSWATFATLLTNYLPTFLKANRDLSATAANAANLFASVMVVALVLLFSPIADRIGLRRTMIIGPVVLIVLVIPGFALAGHGVIGGFLGAGILGACKGVLAVPMLLAVSQIFPPGVRVTAGGLGYNVAASVFGGTAPLRGRGAQPWHRELPAVRALPHRLRRRHLGHRPRQRQDVGRGLRRVLRRHQRRYAHPGGQPVDDLTLLRDFDRSNRKSRQSP